MADTRAPRADAQRNRDHILEIAEQYFAEHGVVGSLDGIAKRAGVGPGTLYRHFPTRGALLAALMTARDEELFRRRDEITSTAPDSAEALHQWLLALIEWASAFDGLPNPLREALSEEASPLAHTCQGFTNIIDGFLTAAQHDGLARSEVRASDLFLLTLAVSWARGAALADGTSATAMTQVLRNGWSTPSTTQAATESVTADPQP